MTKRNIDVDQFRSLIARTRVKCEECDHKEHNIVPHVKEAHGYSPNQYKSKYPSTRLVSPVLSEMLSRMGRSAYKTTDLDPIAEEFNLLTDDTKVFSALEKIMGVTPENLQDLIPESMDNFFFPMEEVQMLAAGIALNKNIFLEGPTGCGKTEGILQVYAKVGQPVERVNLNGDMTINKFLGSMKASPTKGTYFMEGALPRAMKHGYTLLLDEIDYAPPHVLAVLNPVLEGNRHLYIEDTGEHVVAARGFRIIATANTGGKGDMMGVYTGTEVLNTAFLDRFGVKINWDYLPENQEVKMLSDRYPGEDLNQIEMVVQLANDVRNSFKQGSMATTISTRKLIDYFDLCTLVENTVAFEVAVLNWLDSDERDTVNSITQRVGLFQ